MGSLSTDSTLRANCCNQLRKDRALFLSRSQEAGFLFETLDSSYSCDLLGSFCGAGRWEGKLCWRSLSGSSVFFLPPTNPGRTDQHPSRHPPSTSPFFSLLPCPSGLASGKVGRMYTLARGPVLYHTSTPQHSHSSLRAISSSSTLKH